eukprot:GHVN01075602.1.p1 GENE.GHVN01075602.1~~GHVN01075602.1.p1  ORF type:complete len:254 (-),score=19.14 GHVN01075602.1:89-850(-)
MLQAQKAQFAAELSVSRVKLLQVELDYWLNVFDKMGTIASYFAGFASATTFIGFKFRRHNLALNSDESVSPLDSSSFDAVFLFFSLSAFGMNILQVLICSMCNLWAPGRALRGEGAQSYSMTISLLRRWSGGVTLLFQLGLLSYMISAALASLMLFSWEYVVLLVPLIIWLVHSLYRQISNLSQAFISSSVGAPDLEVSGIDLATNNIGVVMHNPQPPIHEPLPPPYPALDEEERIDSKLDGAAFDPCFATTF